MTPFAFQPEMLSAMLDGELTPEQRAAVQSHLATHPRDARLLEEMQRLRAQLAGLPAVTAPPDLRQRIMTGIRDHQASLASAAVSTSSPGGSRMGARLPWMIACAASLAALIIGGAYLNMARQKSRLVATIDPAQAVKESASSEIRPSSGSETAVEKPGDSAERAQSQNRFDAGQEKSAVADGPMAPGAPAVKSAEALALKEEAAVRALQDAEPAIAANESEKKMDQVLSAAVGDGSGGAKGGGERGGEMIGGLAGQLPERDAPMASEIDRASTKLADQSDAPAPAPAPPASEPARDEICVRLDKLIFVQVPPGQPVEEWIAAVFRQAEVQMDLGVEPDSFSNLVQQRTEDRRLARAEAGADRLEADGGGREPSAAGAAQQFNQPAISPAPEYLRPDARTTAYWVDAEVCQIQNIMNRLDGAAIIGFPNPGTWGSSSEGRVEQKAFPAHPAFARRLDHLMVPLQSGDSDRSDRRNQLRADEKQSPTEPAMTALGLDGQPPTARYRLLFVFHAVPDPVSAAPHSIPSEPEPHDK